MRNRRITQRRKRMQDEYGEYKNRCGNCVYLVQDDQPTFKKCKLNQYSMSARATDTACMKFKTRRRIPDKDRKIMELHKEGLTAAQITSRLGGNNTHVYDVVKRWKDVIID